MSTRFQLYLVNKWKWNCGVIWYYLTVIPESDLEPAPGRDLTVGITTFLSHCVFWDEVQGTWDNSGCQVRRGR